jgi:histone-lysine N-methyltransferase SETD1
VDENYVGEPPKVEVTIENLNDNVDNAFLQNMVAR